ncbi:unannotated protein [freshwater metagenome]|uniref:Unannotated protein n=1 Tax=freshwater metagenome TaxID=449393 RepID=A0A6J7R097_9ZZZZ
MDKDGDIVGPGNPDDRLHPRLGQQIVHLAAHGRTRTSGSSTVIMNRSGTLPSLA